MTCVSGGSSSKLSQNGDSAISTKFDEAISSSSLIENGEVGCSSAGSTSATVTKDEAKSITSSLPTKSAVQMEETDSEESTDDEYNHENYGSDSDDEVHGSESENPEDEEEEDEDDEEEEEEGLTDEDEKFMNSMIDEPGKDSGCTAVVAVLRGNKLYVANAGDSRFG